MTGMSPSPPTFNIASCTRKIPLTAELGGSREHGRGGLCSARIIRSFISQLSVEVPGSELEFLTLYLDLPALGMLLFISSRTCICMLGSCRIIHPQEPPITNLAPISKDCRPTSTAQFGQLSALHVPKVCRGSTSSPFFLGDSNYRHNIGWPYVWIREAPHDSRQGSTRNMGIIRKQQGGRGLCVPSLVSSFKLSACFSLRPLS
jgi:hypothetical protein